MKLNTEKIIARKDGKIGWMIINNPEKRNAISLSMREAMTQVFNEYDKDPEVRVLIIRGSGGKAFISGADISEFKDIRSNYDAEEKYAKATEIMTKAMNAFKKPILAMIEGYCVGGGVATAIACDMRIATKDTKYGIPAAKFVVPSRGSRTHVQLVLLSKNFEDIFTFSSLRKSQFIFEYFFLILFVINSFTFKSASVTGLFRSTDFKSSSLTSD